MTTISPQRPAFACATHSLPTFSGTNKGLIASNDTIKFGLTTQNEQDSLNDVVTQLSAALADGKLEDIKVLNKNDARITLGGKQYLFHRGGTFFTLTRRVADTQNYESRWHLQPWKTKTKTRDVIREIEVGSGNFTTAGNPLYLRYHNGFVFSRDDGMAGGGYYPLPSEKNLDPKTFLGMGLYDHVGKDDISLSAKDGDKVTRDAHAFMRRLETTVFTADRVNATTPRQHLEA